MSASFLHTLGSWGLELTSQFAYVPIALGAAAALSPWVRRWVMADRFGTNGEPQRLGSRAIWALVLLPPLFWLASLRAALKYPDSFMRVTVEDGWIENTQEIVLLAGVVLSVLIGRHCLRQRQRVWGWGYLLFAVALFWAAGEEISWGQRLFHIPTPEWFASHNVQQEMNLHNLGDTDDRLSNLMDAGLVALVFITALAPLFGLTRLRRAHTPFWAPHPALLPALLCVLSHGSLLNVYDLPDGSAGTVPEPVEQMQESRELILYTAIAVFLWVAYRHARTLAKPALSAAPDEKAPQPVGRGA